eukprot:660397-Amphidinium_carterae.2
MVIPLVKPARINQLLLERMGNAEGLQALGEVSLALHKPCHCYLDTQLVESAGLPGPRGCLNRSPDFPGTLGLNRRSTGHDIS